jgi:hypothetical protein
MYACAAACVIDTVYQLIYASAQTRAWRIEFSYNDIRDYGARLKGQVRDTELILLTVPRTHHFNRAQYPKYLFTKFDSPHPPSVHFWVWLAKYTCLNASSPEATDHHAHDDDNDGDDQSTDNLAFLKVTTTSILT